MTADNPLHRARLARGLELADIARRTYLSPQVVQKIDAGRFDQLPAGVYARSYVRAFATAVDLDPEQVLTSIADRLPSTDDPMPVMRDVAERKNPSWSLPLVPLMRTAGARVAAALAPVARLPRWPDWRGGTGMLTGVRAGEALTRLCRSASNWRHPGGSTPLARRAAAVAVDVALLVLLHVVLVQLTAWTTGTPPETVREAAGIGVTTVWGLLVVQYYVLLGGLGGRTPGAWLSGLRHRARTPYAEPLGLRAILHRTVLY